MKVKSCFLEEDLDMGTLSSESSFWWKLNRFV